MKYQIFDKTFWWKDKEESHEAVNKFITVLRNEQAEFYETVSTHMGLYNGKPLHNKDKANIQYYPFNMPSSHC